MGIFFSLPKYNNYPDIFNVHTSENMEELLLENDIDMLHNGETPLTHAATNGRYSQVKLYLLYGANPNPQLETQTFSEFVKDREIVLNEQILSILSCFGFPNDNFDREQMEQEVEECLNSRNDEPRDIVNSFIRSDDKEAITSVLSDGEMYNYIRKKLSDEHAYVWMKYNDYKLHYTE
jgi:hypothetical protein